jgi:long-chain acyl-CoA synthetase
MDRRINRRSTFSCRLAILLRDLCMEAELSSEQKSLRDFLAAQARRFEKKVFLETAGEQFSYAAVDDRTDRAATGLSRLGLRAGDRVALLLSNRAELVFFLLGAPKLGMVPVPIHPACSHEEIISILWHCGATAVITERRFEVVRQIVPQIRHWFSVDDDSFAKHPFYGLTGGSVLGFWPDLDPGDAALISYSPAVNRNRKAVVLTHYNLLSNCYQLLQPFRIDETDRFMCALPLSSAMTEVLLLLAPWAAGGTCILRDAAPASLPRAIKDSCATVLAGMPEFYRQLAESPDFAQCDLSSLRLAVCSSGPVAQDVFRQFEERHDAVIVEGYGLVEATCLTCANPYTGVLKPGSVGLTLPGQECRVVDEMGKERPPGETGEIVIRGPNVMKEYFRDPGSTARSLRSDWLFTGDRGYIDSDGYYYLSPAG